VDLTLWFTDKGFHCVKPYSKVPKLERELICEFFNTDDEFALTINH